jgi:hypothetical protein
VWTEFYYSIAVCKTCTDVIKFILCVLGCGVLQYLDIGEDLGSCYADNHDAASVASVRTGHSSGSASASGRGAASSSSTGISPVKARVAGGSTQTSPLKARRTGSSTTGPCGALAGRLAEAQVHDVVMGALKEHLILHGATVTEHLHHGVTHIIMRPEQLSRACKMRVSVFAVHLRACVYAGSRWRCHHWVCPCFKDIRSKHRQKKCGFVLSIDVIILCRSVYDSCAPWACAATRSGWSRRSGWTTA